MAVVIEQPVKISANKVRLKAGGIGNSTVACDVCNVPSPCVYICCCGHKICVECGIGQEEHNDFFNLWCNFCKRTVSADLFEEKKQLKIRDLPASLATGKVHLRPLGGLGRRLIPCDGCNMFSPRIYTCACGHAFCVGCTVVRMDGESSHEPQAWCLECRSIAPADLVEIKEYVLRQMRFACSCGTEGTLVEIKKHIWDAPDAHMATTDKSPTPIAETGVRPDNLFRDLREDIQTLKKQLRNVTITTNKHYFWFDLIRLIEQHEQLGEKTVSSDVKPWQVGGYSCGFFCQISTRDEGCYLDLFIRTVESTSSSAPWPMRKKCVFTLYDVGGRAVVSHSSLLFHGGDAVHPCFIAPSRERKCGYGPTKFIKIADILDRCDELLFDGRACFSVELQDL